MTKNLLLVTIKYSLEKSKNAFRSYFSFIRACLTYFYGSIAFRQQRGFSGGGNRGGRFARGGAGSQSGDYGGSGDSQQDLEEEVDFEQATNQLCYDNTSLRDQRVNA